MAKVSLKELESQGYIFLKKYYPNLEIQTIANMLGIPITPWSGRLVQNLTPKENSSPNTYSGIYGLSAFPFHTDLAHWKIPPRYLLLRCINGYSEVPTLILQKQFILESVPGNILSRAIFKPRRPLNGSLPLLMLHGVINGKKCFRWDEVFIKPASKIGNVANKQIRDVLLDAKPLTIELIAKGDTLLIDNWQTLHSRSEVPANCMNREIQRIYLRELF